MEHQRRFIPKLVDDVHRRFVDVSLGRPREPCEIPHDECSIDERACNHDPDGNPAPAVIRFHDPDKKVIVQELRELPIERLGVRVIGEEFRQFTERFLLVGSPQPFQVIMRDLVETGLSLKRPAKTWL